MCNDFLFYVQIKKCWHANFKRKSYESLAMAGPAAVQVSPTELEEER